ncbi:MAG: hypothetical protein WC460_04270 [Patescibacteria group bacterium]
MPKNEIDGYPDGFRIRSRQEQVETLLSHFSNLDPNHIEELAKGNLPESAEGWAVIPSPGKIAPTYFEALKKILEHIPEISGYWNWREELVKNQQHLELVWKTKKTHDFLMAKQPGDFWVFPFQFGKNWPWVLTPFCEVKRTMRFADNEFGFGPYELAILMLTHPDRITGPYQQYVYSAGCEHKNKAGFNFSFGFSWSYGYEKQTLQYGMSNRVEEWGDVTGFLSP